MCPFPKALADVHASKFSQQNPMIHQIEGFSEVYKDHMHAIIYITRICSVITVLCDAGKRSHLSAVQACCEAFRLRSFSFTLSWILSSTFGTCGKTEICLIHCLELEKCVVEVFDLYL